MANLAIERDGSGGTSCNSLIYATVKAKAASGFPNYPIFRGT